MSLDPPNSRTADGSLGAHRTGASTAHATPCPNSFLFPPELRHHRLVESRTYLMDFDALYVIPTGHHPGLRVPYGAMLTCSQLTLRSTRRLSMTTCPHPLRPLPARSKRKPKNSTGGIGQNSRIGRCCFLVVTSASLVVTGALLVVTKRLLELT